MHAIHGGRKTIWNSKNVMIEVKEIETVTKVVISGPLY